VHCVGTIIVNKLIMQRSRRIWKWFWTPTKFGKFIAWYSLSQYNVRWFRV